jgi:hypothetical protein
MIESLEIRESSPDDFASLEALYRCAFPNEDLLPLVRDLLQETGRCRRGSGWNSRVA